ncbi:MAG: hypothetical protein GVY18_09065 [Bacteroidetes bacterium]|nr:hypothetical protein [Bacteroidota bacterium]
MEAAPITWDFTANAVPRAVGAAKLAQHAAPPQIVWIYTEASHIDDILYNGPRTVSSGTQGQPFKARRLSVGVHIFAKSHDDAETLLEEVMAATWRTCRSSARFDGERWPIQEQHEWAKRGGYAILKLLIDHPVDATQWSTAEVSTVSTTRKMDP